MAVAPNDQQQSLAAASDCCFHCLQPIPEGVALQVVYQGQAQAVCCQGCQAVAETIIEKGLSHFYQYRDTSNPQDIALIPDELSALEAYDNEQLQRGFVGTDKQGLQQITLSVDGMTCAACAWLIERQLQQQPAVKQVLVNASTDRVQLHWDAQQQPLSELLKAIARVGYRALPFQQANSEADIKRRKRQLLKRLGVAGLATMQVMMVAFALYFGVVSDLDSDTRHYLWLVSLLFATPVIGYSATPFYISALRSLQAAKPNMDVPVSIALLATYGASAYATFSNHGEVYFESVAMFTFFLLIGRYLELATKQRAISYAANLMKLVPALATRIDADGQTQAVAVSALDIGDIIVVKPGATVPADGELLSSQGWLSESVLTGESQPQAKAQGEQILAGSVNQQQPIQIRVNAANQQTVLASIVALQDNALAHKPKLGRLADSLANDFVSKLLVITALTYAGWYWFAPEQAFWVALSVLVATCPCALSLAAPTALTGAVHQLNSQGILLKDSAALETMHAIDTVVFDKTGTLSNGEFSLLDSHYNTTSEWSTATLQGLTSSLEKHSEHPLARLLQQWPALPADAPLSNIENHGGAGLSANYAGQAWRLGALDWIKQWHPQYRPTLPQANVILANQTQVLAEYWLDDALRDDAVNSVAQLGKVTQLQLLSGDSSSRVEQCAQTLAIDTWQANCKPADKLAQVAALQQQGHHVMMVGDGINDSPVLAQADLSVTFANAADMAKSSADVVILKPHLQALLNLREIALRCRRIMRQNLSWAVAYNVIIIPLAVAGLVTPYIAVLGMSFSSLLVVLNSLRLYPR
ncbi:heavy metal translocating P-type ATPase [Idiomarina xiamenensis]|uniref:Cation transport ATPase n=1 Tax=Idiomarina xiamenensis 10-D-4 TaxID=740709 RepID=K2LB10_9GAMM|nr:heavy metal translocating P-type ATPase [Idiomarina xiamenensis]EKE87000.1 cation transport ATPase [Idiomarina xiamenensis 10-D-4]